jgi:hypothetical protein
MRLWFLLARPGGAIRADSHVIVAYQMDACGRRAQPLRGQWFAPPAGQESDGRSEGQCCLPRGGPRRDPLELAASFPIAPADT